MEAEIVKVGKKNVVENEFLVNISGIMIYG
jgi:hypothetical protein